MRFIGLDIGSKRIGVSVSDELGWTAQPLETLKVKNTGQTWKRLFEIMDMYQSNQFVVGMPLNMNGTKGPQAFEVEKFMNAFCEFSKKRKRDIHIIFWDERLSSKEAENVLLEADISRAKRTKVIDKLAASVILQSYLNSIL